MAPRFQQAAFAWAVEEAKLDFGVGGHRHDEPDIAC